jgi:hypothetical protein
LLAITAHALKGPSLSDRQPVLPVHREWKGIKSLEMQRVPWEEMFSAEPGSEIATTFLGALPERDYMLWFWKPVQGTKVAQDAVYEPRTDDLFAGDGVFLPHKKFATRVDHSGGDRYVKSFSFMAFFSGWHSLNLHTAIVFEASCSTLERT